MSNFLPGDALFERFVVVIFLEWIGGYCQRFFPRSRRRLAELTLSVFFVPLAVLSSWLGSRLMRLVDPKAFTAIIPLILLAISLVLIGQAYNDATG